MDIKISLASSRKLQDIVLISADTTSCNIVGGNKLARVPGSGRSEIIVILRKPSEVMGLWSVEAHFTLLVVLNEVPSSTHDAGSVLVFKTIQI